MEEMNVMENINVTEMAEDCVEVLSSSDNKGGKILAVGVGVGIAIGTAVGYFRSKNKKTDKPKKLNWVEKKFVKSLEKKGVQVAIPVDVGSQDSEPVENNE